ncbi:hypothetical protein [Pasteuria penetrans]|uniref:hypothetical protein n=1 Tax=Pasteuria penetrans TaxID=86005 RepID=UPI000FBD7FDF|nr:hypothetical protein [Pasteuria penetrans]
MDTSRTSGTGVPPRKKLNLQSFASITGNMLSLLAYEEKARCNGTQGFFQHFITFQKSIIDMISTCCRMDSTLIKSNIRKLTCNEMICLVAKNVVCVPAELLIPLPAGWEVFLEKGCKVTDIESRQSLSHQPPLPPKEGVTTKDHGTAELIMGCLAIRKCLSKYDKIRSIKGYALLERVIWEQTEEDERGNLRMLLKVRSGSPQSPYDPDAQYRKKNKQECWRIFRVDRGGS